MRLTPFSDNTMPPVVMYISCFVGPCCTSSLSSHQTFILQKRIYISRDPARLNLAGASTSPPRPCYRSLRMFCVLVWHFSSLPLPPPPHTHTHCFVLILFCLKASLSFHFFMSITHSSTDYCKTLGGAKKRSESVVVNRKKKQLINVLNTCE